MRGRKAPRRLRPRADRSGTSLAKRVLWALPYVSVVIGLLIIAAPTISDMVVAWRAGGEISAYTATVDAIPAERVEALLEQAMRYNVSLSGDASVAAELLGEGEPGEELLPYDEQLRTGSSTMMAWLEIPSIDLRLPVYHGTGDAELAVGVGHMQDSSLPVGGTSTHCVLLGHTGMVGTRMFDDIRLLEPGDVFLLWTLDHPLAYEVTGSEVVLPDELDSLRIRQGEDLCTLATCTPYGINTHRLLVHARRCAYESEAIAEMPAHISSRFRPLLAALAAIGATLLLLAAIAHRRRRAKGARG